MDITGNTFRRTLPVRQFSFSKTLDFSNCSGTHYFGFSGESQTVKFKFQSGKIFDPEDRLVFTYNELKNLKLSGDFSTGTYQYYIDDILVCSKGSKSNFIADRFIYEVESGTTVTFEDFFIYTDSSSKDSLSVNFDTENFIESGSITGNIVNGGNSEAKNVVFTGQVSTSGNFNLTGSFPIVIDPSGEFVLQASTTPFRFYESTLTFTTATGDISKEVTFNKIDTDSTESYKYGSGQGIVTNTTNQISESLSLNSLSQITLSDESKRIEFDISYTRFSGTSLIAQEKDLSVKFSIDPSSYNYGGSISSFFSGKSGTSIFQTGDISLDSAIQTLSGQTTLSETENTFYIRIENSTGSQAFDPNIYYQISGQSTAITGIVSGVDNA